ncbi:phytase [Melghirimyces algeriensis]|uniref:3-phytase n=1 Tax=Melghirimyces algeriensis TaxID=910412 RepID=A0A521EKV4_9BACL|nr:phytase [Melghirimyces algeriensis]SMO84101.1 3-phytase [Melghirimyces algeriensis]
MRKIVISCLLTFFMVFHSFTGVVEGRPESRSPKPLHVEVTADAETEPVESEEDAADDPAIWVHPTDSEKSLLIGTDKKKGLNIYNLEGKQVNSVDLGRINNVDVRYNFPLGEKKVDIVAGTNRTTNTIDIFSISQTGKLKNIAAHPIQADMTEVYGFSLYQSRRSGDFYAMVVGKQGEFEQYRLYDNGKGRVKGKKVREFKLGSKAEGMVVDDEYGYLYIAEEEVAIWKYDAEPNGDREPTIVDRADGNHLHADIEGLTLYYGAKGKGYLIASSQGDNSYAIYDRKGKNKYIGNFRIVDGDKTDGTEETDGIDVIGFGLGDAYPYGLFIAQDGQNRENGRIANQNFKMVRWETIAESFCPELWTDDAVNPRTLTKRKR